jgi:TPR repeat protein
MNEIYKEKSSSDRAMELKAKIILANLGDSNAQNEIGLAYETGDHVQQDFDKAIEWHKLAADQGNLDSAFRIGRIYHFGLGDDQNFYEAAKWYEIASAGNHDLARVNLGLLYINGEGVAQDYKNAEDLFRAAAAQGTHDAQNNLGAMYSMGLGVSPNDEEAFKWYLLAAKQGNQKAQLSIGLMYKDGIGVPQNSEDAYRWLYESAVQGDDGAQLHLGWMLIQGDGVPENRQEGLEWLKASAGQGNEVAEARIAALNANDHSESEEFLLDDLFKLQPMVGTSDDGACWLLITVEELLWTNISVVTLGGMMRKTEKIECNTNEISDCSNLINRGFDEIQISRGSQSDGDDIILVPGDKVIIDWRSQQYQDQSFRGEWRMTYHALLDGKQWGYLGDLSDYYYGENEQVKEQVKSAKINIVDLADSDEETKKWYRNMIEEDCNQQFGNIPQKADDNL